MVFSKNKNVTILCGLLLIVVIVFACLTGSYQRDTYITLSNTGIKVPSRFVFNGEIARHDSTQLSFVSYYLDGKTGHPTRAATSRSLWVRLSIGDKGLAPQVVESEALNKVSKERTGYSLHMNRKKYWAVAKYPMPCDVPRCRELLEVWISGSAANLTYHFYSDEIDNWDLYHRTVLNSAQSMGWKQSDE